MHGMFLGLSFSSHAASCSERGRKNEFKFFKGRIARNRKPCPQIRALSVNFDDLELHFAYGANMAASTLSRRGLKPIKSFPCQVCDQHTWLSFQHRSGFATLIKGGGSPDYYPLQFQQPHGVLHTISRDDLKKLESAETGYGLEQIAVKTYDGEVFSASVFVSTRLLVLRSPVPPELRYVDLMRQGAKLHQLDGTYMQWLLDVPSYFEGTRLGPEYFDSGSEWLAKGLLGAVCLGIIGFFCL